MTENHKQEPIEASQGSDGQGSDGQGSDGKGYRDVNARGKQVREVNNGCSTSKSEKGFSILLVEDSENDGLLLKKELQRQEIEGPLKRVETAREMNEALDEGGWDLVISDYSLPKFSAPKALELLQDRGLDLPFIVLSGTIGEEAAVEAMRAGAHDYFVKGRVKRLGEAIRRELEAARVRGEKERTQRNLEHLNRVLRAVRNVSQLILRDRDSKDFIENVCKEIVATRGYAGAWLRVESKDFPGPCIAQSGFDGNFNIFKQRIEQGWLPPCCLELEASLMGISILSPKEQCQDCPLQKGCSKGTRTVTVSLAYGSKHYGTLAIIIPQGIDDLANEESLLLELAKDLSLAFHGLENDRLRRAAEERFNYLFDAMAQGVVYQDKEGNIIEANQAAERILGLGKEQMLERHSHDERWQSLDEEGKPLPGDQHPAMRALEEGKPFKRTMGVFNPKEGAYRQLRVHAVPEFKEGEDSPFRVFTTFEDITELLEEEHLFNFAIEQMPVPVVIAKAPNGDIIHYNDGVLDMLAKEPEGFSLDELELQHHREFWPTFHPDGSPYEIDELPLTKAIKRGIHTQNEEIILMQGERKRWISASAAPLRNREGEIVAGIVVFPETTEVKSAETALRESEAKLNQAQKMESIGRLASGVAHDFNNLLTAINSYTELVLEALEEDSPVANDLQEVLFAGQRARELTKQLLTFSRKQVIEAEEIDLNKIVRQIDGMLERVLGEDIIVETKLDKDLPSILADSNQIEQVLMNLAVNARDAMPRGGRLLIETEALRASNGAVIMRVKDEGCGMTEETKARIFDPFFTTKEKEKGTGLGLSTVYGIVKQSKGSISIDTEPGKGSSFTLEFPPCPKSTKEIQNDKCTIGHKARGELILVVEDEATISPDYSRHA